MATPGMQSGRVVGTVKGVDGVVTAINSNGVIRTLKAGDKVYAGETVQTADGANAHIDFARGGFATLGAGQSLPMDGAVLSQAADAARPQQGQTQTPAASDTDVETLQQQIEEAIAKGEDPTQLLEAAAAGPGAGGGGGQEGSSFVVVEQNAARGNVTPGFDTGTFGNPFQNPYEYYGERTIWSPDFTGPDGLAMAGLEITLYEGGLPGGNKTGGDATDGGSYFVIDTHNEGLAGLTIAGADVMAALGGTPVSVSIPGFPGEFIVTSIVAGPAGTYTVNYTYELTGVVQNAPGEDSRDFSFDITATDGVGGQSSTAGVTITVVDDNPIARDDYRHVTETELDGEGVVSGNVVSGDGDASGADAVGADGQITHEVSWSTGAVTTDNAVNASDGSRDMTDAGDFKTSFSLTGTGPDYTVMDGNGNKVVGTLTLNADGSYEFEIDEDYELEHGLHTINIPYTLTDNDGDAANAVLHITLENVNDQPVLTVDSGAVKETGVWAEGERSASVVTAENNETAAGGTDNGKHQLTVSGQLTATDADGDTLTFGVDALKLVNQTWTDNGNGTITITDAYGALTINTATGAWTFVLDDGEANHLDEGASKVVNFPVSVMDNSGTGTDTATGTLPITIWGTNDRPTLTVGNDLTVTEGTGNQLSSGSIVNTTGNTKVEGEAAGQDADDGANLKYGFNLDGEVKQTLYVVPDGSGGYTLSTTLPSGGNYYGTLTIDSGDGQYSFTLNNAAECVQKMNNDDILKVEGVTVVVQDEHGAYDTGSFNVTINGANDAPFITGGTAGTVKETGVWASGGRSTTLNEAENNLTTDGGTTDGKHKGVYDGKVTAADVDDTVLTFSADPAAKNVADDTFPGTDKTCQVFEGTYGKLYLMTDGTYRYVLDNAKADKLAEGASQNETFKVVVMDAHGGTGTGTITITVKGTNDAPVFTTAEAVYDLAEDGDSYAVNGKVEATDVDTGDGLAYGLDAEGTVVQKLYAVPDGNGGVDFVTTQPANSNYYGVFTIDKTTGAYTFQMNNNALCVQSLGTRDIAKIVVPVVVQDLKGAYDKQSVTINISGADDKASFDMSALNPSQTVIEAGVAPKNTDYAGQPEAKGTLVATDPDGNDQLVYKVKDKDGEWHTLGDETDAAYDSDSNAWIIETAHGTVVFKEKDGGGYDYTYKLDNDDPTVNALDSQKTMPDGFDVKVESVDGDDTVLDTIEGKVNITIVGTNDRPVIVDNEITISKGDADNALDGSFAGKLMVSDVDTGHHGNTGAELADGAYNLTVTGEGGKNFVEVYAADGETVVGFASIKPDGSYSIQLNSTGKAMLKAQAEDEYLEVKTAIRVKDPNGAWTETDVTWKLEGTDDNPLLNNVSGSIGEDGWLSGRPVILDKDTRELVDNPDYAEDNRPDSVSGTLSATAVDKTDEGAGTFTYSLNLDADNDGKVYVISDNQGGYTVVNTVPSGADLIGTMKLDGGTWTFELNQESDTVNKLVAGDKLDVRIEATVTDGRGYSDDANINITINGTNDRPTIAEAETLELGTQEHNREASYSVSGTATANDPDNKVLAGEGNTDNLGGTTDTPSASEITFCFIDPDTGQPTQSLQLEYGTVTIDAKTGEYTYVFNVFDEGNYKEGKFAGGTETFDVYARDTDGAYSEKQPVTVEVAEQTEWTHGTGGGAGGITVDGDLIALQEDNGDVTGTGDASVRGGGGTVTGGLGYYFIDADGNKVQSLPAVDANGVKYGTYVIDPITGEYELILDNGSDRVQELNEGETINVGTIVDGALVPPTVGNFANGGTAPLPAATVEGTNDLPVFSQDVYGENLLEEDADQDGGQSVSGKIVATDVDEGGAVDETLTYGPKDPDAGNVTDNGDTYTIAGQYGDLVINKETGEWTYTVRDGENIPHHAKDEVFDVIVTDSAGGTDTAGVVIDLEGRNTAPEYKGDPLDTLVVKEDTGADTDGYIIATGSIDKSDFTDADDDTIQLTVAADKNGDGKADGAGAAYAVGQYGTLFLNADGTYEYRLNNDMDAVQGLKEGESLTDKFVIIGSDGNGGKVEIPLSVTVDGTNDDPVLHLNDPSGNQYGAGVSLDMVEGQVSVGGQAAASDVDTNDICSRYSFKDGNDLVESVEATATINGESVVVGTFTINRGTGEYTFTPNDNIDQLKAGDQISVSADVVVESSSQAITDSDSPNGGSTSATVTVNITGTNDAPTLDTVVIEKTEDGGDYVATGTLTARDPDADAGDVVSYSVKTGDGVTQQNPTTWIGKYGTLVLNTDGSYTYTLDNSKVQSLGEGEKAYDNFDILAKDKYGATSETENGIRVEITGTNDVPVLDNIAPANLTQAGEVTGTFTASDVDTTAELKFSVEDATSDNSEFGFDHYVTGEHGTLYYNRDTGAYKYVANADTNTLGQGVIETDTFQVTVTDDKGASPDAKPLTVIITGTNDVPVLDAVATGTAITEGNTPVTGLFMASDVDAGDTLVFNVENAQDATGKEGFNKVVHGSYGDLYYNRDTGAYTYEAGNGLAANDIATENFVVSVSDGMDNSASQDLKITVTGINDAPVLDAATGTLALSATADSLEGAITFSDVDGDTLTLSIGDTDITADGQVVHGLYGDLTINPDGTYTYELNGSPETMEALANSDGPLTESFETSVTDGNLSDSSTLSIDITHSGEFTDTYLGTAAPDTLSTDDTHHYLYGGAGDDILTSHGAGNILTGGDGNDIFILAEGSTNTMIMDFRVGDSGTDSDADVLDIRALLDSYSGDGKDLLTDGYITLNVTEGPDGTATVVLGVDRDGAAGSGSGGTLATIHMDGVAFNNPSSGSELEQQLLEQLMSNDQIKF